MEFLVFRLFFGTKHKGPLNKVQVWGYSDAVANATAPCWPTMLAKLPNRPCAWKAPQLHCLSDVNPSDKLRHVAILLLLEQPAEAGTKIVAVCLMYQKVF